MGNAAQAADAKAAVRDFWNAEACGESYAIGAEQVEQMNAQAAARFALEPYILPFAGFSEAPGRDVLEVGVGMGADHQQWAKAGPESLTGIDLTPRAIDLTTARLQQAGLHSDLQVADAENLPFADNSFDIVYSWGVLHHSPDTQQAFREVQRVLRPGGVAKIMVYHTWSLTGFMLWVRYALLGGKPWMGMAEVYSRYLESPGTKAYTVAGAKALCEAAGFATCRVWVQLNHGDLLEGNVGQRHQGGVLSLAKRLWPRAFIRRFLPFLGLYVMIEAHK